MFKLLLKWLGILVLLLLTAMLVITMFTGSLQPQVTFKGKAQEDPKALNRLAEIIRFRTVSYDDSSDGIIKIQDLNKLFQWMKESYPLVFQSCITDTINHSRLLTFKGSDPSLKPALFLAHLDVVAAEESSTGNWKFPPFSGMITSDTVYGRGTLDDKSIATAMLEAMENLLVKGFKPKRTIMFAFGHDEETGGKNGAVAIAAFLRKKGILPEFICDEGFGVMEGLVPGTQKPVAIIGTAEKGYMSVKFTVDIAGGHSGTPKKENATAVITRCLYKVENLKFLEQITEPQQAFFRHIAPETNFPYRLLFSNLWITSPLVKMVLNGNEKSASTINTSHSITVIRAGDKDNVLPAHAEGTVNFRLLPGQKISDVMSMLSNELKDEPVKMSLFDDRNEASVVSPSKGPVWDLIAGSIREVFDSVLVAPGLVVVGTDTKNYSGLTKNIYRFVPLRLNSKNLSGIHGSDEKIASKNYYEAISYYKVFFGKL